MTDKLIPLFRIKPLDATRAIIKFKGSINEDDKILDEILDIDNKSSIPIDTIDTYVISGTIFKCTIVGTHIVKSRTYPVFYVDIHYEKPLVSGSLFQVMYTIMMDPNDKKQIINNKQYVNLQFNGSWVRHIECDEELQKKYDEMLSDMLEQEAINIIYSSDEYKDIRNSTEEDIIHWISNYIANEKKEYNDIIQNKSFVFTNINKIKQEIVNLCGSNRFHKFIKIALLCRDETRRTKYGIKNEDYIKPNISLYVDKLKQQMIDNDELIKN